MIYNCGQRVLTEGHKIGDKIWAFRLDRCRGTSGRLHNVPPVLGEICGDSMSGVPQFTKFIPYKKAKGSITNELATSKSMKPYYLSFADTYDEAVAAYNSLVKYEIDYYQNRIDKLAKFLIH